MRFGGLWRCELISGVPMSVRVCAFVVSFFLFAESLQAQSVPYEVCAESTAWVRPSPEVQAEIWNMGRYQGFRHDPYEWTHNFLIVPNSASITYDLRNLSGLWTAPPSEQCRSAESPSQRENDWIEVWVLLHRVTQITHDNNTYTITVAPAGAGFQSIMFRRMNPRAVLRFVTADGKQLEAWDESAPPTAYSR
jgi:hypothetical protein